MDEEVCRLCLADTITYIRDTSYVDRIQLVIPEIDLNITPTYTLCENCLDNLNNAYTFREKCLRNEEVIKNYIGTTQTPLIDLRCVKNQIHGDSKESLDEIKVKEEYVSFDDTSITNPIELEDYKDITPISEEYRLMFPKEEIVQRQENELASYRCKEEIKEVENESPGGICKESFKNPIELDQHGIIHSQKNIVEQYKDENYPRKEEIKEEESELMEIFLCEGCNRSFKTSIELDRHHPCDLCDVKFSRKFNLREHRIKHPDKSIQYFCDICNEGFKVKRTLNQHKLVHSNEIYTCSICSSSVPNLQDHMRHCYMTQNICKVCDMKFRTKSILQRHMQTHGGNSSFECKICQKPFTAKANLNRHMITHQQEQRRNYRRMSKLLFK